MKGSPVPEWMEEAAARTPFYRDLPDRGWPRFSHNDEDLEAAIARLGDPLAGRADPDSPASVLVQATRDLPLFWQLGENDMTAMAQGLASVWQSLGVEAGERVVLYDYATSPLVLFASRSFLSHLDRGAADLLSCTPICNDGLPELADRCAHILEYLAPSLLFVDSEAVDPLLERIDSVGPTLRRVVISADETLFSPDRLAAWSDRFQVEVVQMIRSDLALFFAPPCPLVENTFHPPSTVIAEEVLTEAGDTRISVTNTAVTSTVVARYVTPFSGDVGHDGCRCGHHGTSLVAS